MTCPNLPAQMCYHPLEEILIVLIGLGASWLLTLAKELNVLEKIY